MVAHAFAIAATPLTSRVFFNHVDLTRFGAQECKCQPTSQPSPFWGVPRMLKNSIEVGRVSQRTCRYELIYLTTGQVIMSVNSKGMSV